MTDEQVSMDHVLTVAQLIKKLQEFPLDSYVVMSKDGEGNGYSPFSGAYNGYYVPETTWYGEVYDRKDMIENMDRDDPESSMTEELFKDLLIEYPAYGCIVLEPVN